MNESVREDMQSLGLIPSNEPAPGDTPTEAPPAKPRQGPTTDVDKARAALEAERRRILRGQDSAPAPATTPTPETTPASPDGQAATGDEQVTISRAELDRLRRAQGDQSATARRVQELEFELQRLGQLEPTAQVLAATQARIEELASTQGQIDLGDVYRSGREAAAQTAQSRREAELRQQQAERMSEGERRAIQTLESDRKHHADAQFGNLRSELQEYASQHGIHLPVKDADELIVQFYQEPAVRADIQEWGDLRTDQERAKLRFETAMHRIRTFATAELVTRAIDSLDQRQPTTVINENQREQIFGDSSSGTSSGDPYPAPPAQTGRTGRRARRSWAYGLVDEAVREDMARLGYQPVQRR